MHVDLNARVSLFQKIPTKDSLQGSDKDRI